MTEEHISVLREVEQKQPIHLWSPDNWNVANELLAAGFITCDDGMGRPSAWGNRNMPFRNVRLDISGREKMKEWQDAIDEKKPLNRLLSALKRFSNFVFAGIGLFVGTLIGLFAEDLWQSMKGEEPSPEVSPTQQPTSGESK